MCNRVVQRQLWLMENGIPERVLNEAAGTWELVYKPCTKEQAYDMARKEFYLERQREDIRRRVLVEEARYVGAYFGRSQLQMGLRSEDKVYDEWRAWAEAENSKMQADRESAYANFGNEDSLKALAEDVEEDAPATTVSSAPI